MLRGRSSSLLAAPLGALVLASGLTACGGSHRHTTATVRARHSRTHAARTTPTTAGTASTGTTSATAVTVPTTAARQATTPGSGGGSSSGSGSGAGGSGGASLGGGTTTTRTTTTTSTSSACHGQDCQGGSPTVPGSVAPVNGKCRSGYVYVSAQDGGPALCVPVTPQTTTATTTQ